MNYPEVSLPSQGGVEAGPVGVASTAPPSSCLRAWVPLEPPSMNTLLQIIWSQRRIETAPTIRLFRSHFKSYLPKWCLAGSGPYRVDFEFHEAWYTKAGFPRKKDAPNLIKCCLDALCERYAIDDSLVWELSCKKINSEEKVGINVSISQYAS